MTQINPFTVEMARYRAETIANVRRFFTTRQVLEVETPVLSAGSGTDRHIDVFSTWYTPDGAEQTELFLQTSPEFFMKRLLCQGFPDIFQIGKVFRNGECGRRHNPEFTMIEWYRRGFSALQLMNEVADLAALVLGPLPVEYLSYQQAFLDEIGIDPLAASTGQLRTCAIEKGACESILSTHSDALNYLMSSVVEPALGGNRLVFIHDYPVELAVLAAPDPSDSRVAQRFELYYKGVELCNGWKELGNATENRRRLDEENTLRIEMGKRTLPPDVLFLSEMERGFPDCAGVALGLDRLIMLGAQKESIGQVLAFAAHEVLL